jgi:two-component sensor histidine kinase
VEISWSITTQTERMFKFRWAESGGPIVIEPPATKQGFGSRLIERMLQNDFSGRVSVSYLPTGLVCELVAPVTALAEVSPPEDVAIA